MLWSERTEYKNRRLIFLFSEKKRNVITIQEESLKIFLHGF